jgi:HlyD family secretion protein
MVNWSKLAEPESLPPLQNDEFLPPIGNWIRLGGWLLVASLAGGLGLAAVIRYNVTVQAIATVRPAEELSLVQTTSEGTIRQVLVKENQLVQQGDVIAELRSFDQLQFAKLQSRRQRIQAYIQQYQAQVDRIDQHLQAITAEDSALEFAQANTAAQGNAAELQTAATPLSSSTNPRDRLQQQRQGLTRQIRYDQATLQAIEQELGKSAILVPTTGTIFRLQLRNPGQAVRPGDVVAQIVPGQASLIFKARVNVQDISQVEVGQPAQLRISAYPYPDYGVLAGTIQAIAPDVTVAPGVDPSMTASYYEVTIHPERPYLTQGNRQFPLQPGMEARADIISRQETVIQAVLRQLRLWVDG